LGCLEAVDLRLQRLDLLRQIILRRFIGTRPVGSAKSEHGRNQRRHDMNRPNRHEMLLPREPWRPAASEAASKIPPNQTDATIVIVVSRRTT
jgi:hypothetical protein